MKRFFISPAIYFLTLSCNIYAFNLLYNRKKWLSLLHGIVVDFSRMPLFPKNGFWLVFCTPFPVYIVDERNRDRKLRVSECHANCLQLADRKQFIKVDLAVLVNVIIDELHGFLIDTNDTISNKIVENVAYNY